MPSRKWIVIRNSFQLALVFLSILSCPSFASIPILIMMHYLLLWGTVVRPQTQALLDESVFHVLGSLYTWILTHSCGVSLSLHNLSIFILLLSDEALEGRMFVCRDRRRFFAKFFVRKFKSWVLLYVLQFLAFRLDCSLYFVLLSWAEVSIDLAHKVGCSLLWENLHISFLCLLL
jgi:hypothetical protein